MPQFIRKIFTMTWWLGILLVGFSTYAMAQAPQQGATSPSLQIGGVTVVCTSGGRPVAWVADYNLQDVGNTAANFLVIRYNPSVVLSLPSHVALFWMGHECGHAFNRTVIETQADCWSAKTGVEQGWFDMSNYDQLAQGLASSPGDNSHPVGTERLTNIKACMQAAGSGNVANSSPPPDDSSHPLAVVSGASSCVQVDDEKSSHTFLETIHMVRLHLYYKNNCDMAVTCPLKVAVGNEPDGNSDHSQWALMKEDPRNAAIDANGEKQITGGVTWAGDNPAGTKLVLRYSDVGEEDEFVMSCTYSSDDN